MIDAIWRRVGNWAFGRGLLIALTILLAGRAMAEPLINLEDFPEGNPARPASVRLMKAYHADGYQQDLAAVGLAAQEWLKWRAPYVGKPALVLDIDETSLSNWLQMVAANFDYRPNDPCDRLPRGPCGALAWDKLGLAPAIRPTRDLFRVALANKVAVFFITGRHEKERAATERGLRKAGFNGWTDLRMEPNPLKADSAADFKAPERAKIEARGYWIIENVGDQFSDLDGGYAERAFKMPNPFYRIK